VSSLYHSKTSQNVDDNTCYVLLSFAQGLQQILQNHKKKQDILAVNVKLAVVPSLAVQKPSGHIGFSILIVF